MHKYKVIKYEHNLNKIVSKGLCKVNLSSSKIWVYYGSGWVGPGLTRGKKLLENRPKICPIPVLIIWSSMVCPVYSVCIYIVKSC